jgi:2,3-bisphosphoglycerate-dependent phosphoglycerate mutase
MTELVFIRHGETDWNRQQRFQGQLDVPLNNTGHAQAQRLAQRLAATQERGTLFSSDLVRAQQTAAPLAAVWGVRPLLLPGLREQGFGVLEGLDAASAQREQPALWRGWLEQEADFAAPGGESQRQFYGRVLSAVQALVAQHSGRLFVVTHGGVLDMLWRSANGLSLSGLRQCAIPNTGINRLRWVDGAVHIELWADDAHLSN